MRERFVELLACYGQLLAALISGAPTVVHLCQLKKVLHASSRLDCSLATVTLRRWR